MRNLKEYIEECEGVALATPANTMGMGNPGMTDTNTMTEPVKTVTAKAKKEKLKKKIKESLLDDENVLIDDVKKNIDNPFYFVSSLFAAGENLSKYKYEIEKMFDKFIKTLKPEKPIKTFVQDEKVAIWFMDNASQRDYNEIIILRPGKIFTGRDNIYGVSNNSKMVIFFLEDFFVEDSNRYGFKTIDDYKKWIEDISKKYKLKASEKDPLVYYTL